MSSDVISLINFCLNEITERSYRGKQSLAKQQKSSLENINQTEEINHKQSEIQHLGGCIKQEKEIDAVQQADNNGMTCAVANNAYKVKSGEKQHNCEENKLDMAEPNISIQNHSGEIKNRSRKALKNNVKPLDTRKIVKSSSDVSGMVFSTDVVYNRKHDNENKKKRKHDCLDDFGDIATNSGATENIRCKKRLYNTYVGSNGEENTYDPTKFSFSKESMKNKLYDTQHKVKRKHKEHSKTKVDSTVDNVEQDCSPSEQEHTNVGNVTLDSDNQHRKKKKPKNLNREELIEYYKLLDEIRVLTKKMKNSDSVKEAATIDHGVVTCDFSNSSKSAQRQKKKKRDKECEKNVQSPVSCKDSAEIDYVRSISACINNKQDIVSKEQGEKPDVQKRIKNKHNKSSAENERHVTSKEQKTDVHGNSTRDDDIHRCMTDSLVQHKKEKQKGRDTINTADIHVNSSQVNKTVDETNTTRKNKKKRRKDNDTEMDAETNNAADFKNTSAAYTHTYTYSVSSVSGNICSDKNIIPWEQRGKKDMQGNDIIDGGIHQCISDTPVKHKKKKHKDPDNSANKSTHSEEHGITSDIQGIHRDTLDDDISRQVERLGRKVIKCNGSSTPKKSKKEQKKDREHSTTIRTQNTGSEDSSMEEAMSSKPSWLKLFSPADETFSPDQLKGLMSKEDDEKIRDAIATFNDNFYLADQNLRNLHIIVDWEVPLLHTIETRPTSVLTKKQVDLINMLNLEVKKGYFSKEENDTILRNFEEFCMRHDLPVDPRLFLKFRVAKGKGLPSAERIHFVQYLAKGLNNRLLNTVYRRFQNMVIPRNCTGRRYTAEEDKLIVDAIRKDKLRLVDLAKILSRHPHSILKRYDKLNNGKYLCGWGLDVSEKLLKAMMEVTLAVKVEELKHRHIHEEEWQRIAKKVGTYAMILKETWYRKLHPQLFIPKDVPTGEVLKEVIRRLRDSNVTKWNEIKWNELAEPFEGWTGLYLKHLMYRFYKRDQRNNLKEFYDYLLKNPATMHGRKRKALVYEDGCLRPV